MLSKEECLNKLRNLKGIQECIEGHINAVGYMALTGSIENYEQLINEHFENREFKEKNFDTVYELYNSLLKDYEKVNKALDKACEELEKLDESHAYECNKQIIEKKGSSTITFGYQTKGEWKEYLLKEVKEDD